MSCNTERRGGAALFLPWATRAPLASAATGSKLTKYLEPVLLPGAGIVVALNGSAFTDGPPTETPTVGTIEDWYYINLTEDTHPMRTHLATFQVVGRVPFNVDAYRAAVDVGPDGVPGGLDPTPYATGPLIPADPS